MFAFVEVAIVAVALAQPSVVTVPALRPLEILPSQEVSRAVFGGTGRSAPGDRAGAERAGCAVQERDAGTASCSDNATFGFICTPSATLIELRAFSYFQDAAGVTPMRAATNSRRTSV
jgi:hypothetical protein